MSEDLPHLKAHGEAEAKVGSGRVCLDSFMPFISDKLSLVHAAISWASVGQ